MPPCGACRAPLAGPPAVRLASSSLHACPACGSWSYFPRPDPAAQAALHDRDDYFDHPYFALRRADTAAQQRRCAAVFRRLAPALDPATLRGQPILDAGCDTGGLLVAARDLFGVLPFGIDVSGRAVAAARERGIEACRSTLEAAPGGFRDFAAITAIDLIEHLPDPNAFLLEVHRRLRPGGAVYLETPNIRSSVYAAGRILAALERLPLHRLLDRLFPAEHLHYFTAAALASMARCAGLDVVAISTRPLPWSGIAASTAVRLAMAPLQALDRVSGRDILICAVLRRPPTA